MQTREEMMFCGASLKNPRMSERLLSDESGYGFVEHLL